MKTDPRFHAMTVFELETFIRENNKNLYDLGEVFSAHDEADEDDEAFQDYREELEAVADDIAFNNSQN